MFFSALQWVYVLWKKKREKMSVLEDKKLFPDFGYGPLTEYRKQSTMDYRKIRLAMKGEEILRVQVSN